MDAATRARYKQLANDSIIATFGRDDNEARLAQALEKCVDDLELHDDCNGPQPEPEAAIVNLDTLQVIHKEMKAQVESCEKVLTTVGDAVETLRQELKDMKDNVGDLGDEL